MNNNSNHNQIPSGPCVSTIHKETNRRIYDRNIPSSMLQPYIDVRPVMTKYSYFPIVDPRAPISTPLIVQPTFNIEQTFNPGNTFSPWSGYASNVNVESELKNQLFALQKCSQSVYVPSSKSDLYEVPRQAFTSSQNTGPNAHYLLFETTNFCKFDPNPNTSSVGANIFLNSTRCQMQEYGLTTDNSLRSKVNK
jgi:hypothetical protein